MVLEEDMDEPESAEEAFWGQSSPNPERLLADKQRQKAVQEAIRTVEKDINDMVLAGHDVMSMLKLNTYSGLQAKIKFNNWKKI